MRSVLLFVCLLFTFFCSYSQRAVQNEFSARNTFFVETGGKAWLFSLNYERRFFYTEVFKMGIQMGAGLNVVDSTRLPAFMEGGNLLFPFNLSWMAGRQAHHAEAGFGVSIQAYSGFNFGRYNYPTLEGGPRVIGTLHLGYRYHPQMGGWVFRVGYTPMFRYFNDTPEGGRKLHHWAGISLGYSLKNANIK